MGRSAGGVGEEEDDEDEEEDEEDEPPSWQFLEMCPGFPHL